VRPGQGLGEYEGVCREMKRRMDRDAEEAKRLGVSLRDLIRVDLATGLDVLPHWLAQPYFRPLPVPKGMVEREETGKRALCDREGEGQGEEQKKARLGV